MKNVLMMSKRHKKLSAFLAGGAFEYMIVTTVVISTEYSLAHGKFYGLESTGSRNSDQDNTLHHASCCGDRHICRRLLLGRRAGVPTSSRRARDCRRLHRRPQEGSYLPGGVQWIHGAHRSPSGQVRQKRRCIQGPLDNTLGPHRPDDSESARQRQGNPVPFRDLLYHPRTEENRGGVLGGDASQVRQANSHGN